jgi:hypothetical protein
MAETFTANLNLDQPELGEYVNSWNVPINGNFTIIDQAIAGETLVTLSNSNVVLTNVQSSFKIIALAGALTANVSVTLSNVTGEWDFFNVTTGAFTVTIKGSSGDTGIVLAQGLCTHLICFPSGSLGSNIMGYTDVASVAGRQGYVTLAVADVSGAAPLASPALTGTPTAPTQATGDNSTAIATDAFVNASIATQVARTPQTNFLTSGSGTYTTPAGATYLEIKKMVGGGSGGGGSGSGSPGVGTAGGATTFGAFTASGGPATPTNTSTTFPTPATASGPGAYEVAGALGAPPNVMNLNSANGVGQVAYGAPSQIGAGGTPSTINDAAATISAGNASGFGAGGGAGGIGSTGATYNSGWGGNAGAYLEAIIPTPAATYAYSIGAAGAGGAAGTNGAAGGAGSAGLIAVVAYFQ